MRQFLYYSAVNGDKYQSKYFPIAKYKMREYIVVNEKEWHVLSGMIFGIIVMLCVLGSTYDYIARRIYQCAVYMFPQINPGIYTGVFALASLHIKC